MPTAQCHRGEYLGDELVGDVRVGEVAHAVDEHAPRPRPSEWQGDPPRVQRQGEPRARGPRVTVDLVRGLTHALEAGRQV